MAITTRNELVEALVFGGIVGTARDGGLDALFNSGGAVPTATTTVNGTVKKAAAQVYFAGADIAALKVELNAFLASMVAAGLMESANPLSLDFVSNTYHSYGVKKQFGELIEFSRSSGGGIWNAQGSFEWLGTDAPRFNYDPVSGSALGLLVEPQSTNYAINSELLSGETLGYTKSPAVTSQAFGRGINRGWSVANTGGSNYAYHTASAETTQTFLSIFAKYPSSPTSGAGADNDFLFRSVVQDSISIKPVREMYRLSGQRSSGSGSWGVAKYAANKGGDVVVSGFQEERERVTSYIPTTTAQVTRAADNVFIPNGSWRSPTGRLEVDADEGVTVTLETGGIRIAGLGNIRSLKFYPEVV